MTVLVSNLNDFLRLLHLQFSGFFYIAIDDDV